MQTSKTLSFILLVIHLHTSFLLKGHYWNLEMSKCCEGFGEDNGLLWYRAVQVLCSLLMCSWDSASQDLSLSPMGGACTCEGLLSPTLMFLVIISTA